MRKKTCMYTEVLSLVKHVNCFPIFFFENEEDTKKGYHEYYFVKHSLNIISVHCACLCVYIYIYANIPRINIEAISIETGLLNKI